MSANFSPKAHVDGDLSMLEHDLEEAAAPERDSLPCNTSLAPNSEMNGNMLVPISDSIRGSVAASECVERAMTPVIGMYSKPELADEGLSNIGIGVSALDSLMSSPRNSKHTPLRA